MSEVNTGPSEGLIDDVTAVDFAETARSITEQSQNWGETKDAMTSWLRTNVGSNVSSSLANMDDLIIASAKDTAYGARDYLNDAKRHLLSLVKNSEAAITTHNNPPRSDADDGTGQTVADIIGWNNKRFIDPNPISPQSSQSGEN